MNRGRPGTGLVGTGDRREQSRPMNVVVLVKQIPDPAAPQSLDPQTRTLVARGQAHLGRLGRLRRRDGPPARRAGRRRRGDPGVDGPQRGDLGPAHGPGHGRGQGHLGERRRPEGVRRPVDGPGAGQGHRAGPARPGHRRHRVDRRLHGHHPGPGGRVPVAAVGHVRQEDLGRRRQGRTSSGRPRPATTRWRRPCPWSSP